MDTSHALPPHVVDAENAVKHDSRDLASWDVLLEFAKTASMPLAEQVYEEFLAAFPRQASVWGTFVKKLQDAGETETAHRVALRAVQNSYSVELWMRLIELTTANRGSDRQVADQIVTRYEDALQAVGDWIDSAPLWTAYLEYRKSLKAYDPTSAAQNRDALRNLYQRALHVPLPTGEFVWKEYQKFELEINENLATALLGKLQASHTTAQAVLIERRKLWDPIRKHLNSIPAPPGPANAELVDGWQQLIRYEKQNPLFLPKDRHMQLIRSLYHRALAQLQFHPEVWFDLAQFESVEQNAAEAVRLLKQGANTIPDSHMLGFAAADYMEMRGETQDARAVYLRLLERSPSALVYIQYMQFERRVSGVTAGRKVFRLARESRHCSPHVYIAAAHLEFHANDQLHVARNVFEMGRRRYRQDTLYALSYVDFLIHTSDPEDVRALFETMLQSLPKEKADPIWDKYIAFEYRQARNGGSLETVAAIERRRAEAYPGSETVVGLPALLQRYRCYGLQPAQAADTEYLQRRQLIVPVARHSVAAPQAGVVPVEAHSATGSSNMIPSGLDLNLFPEFLHPLIKVLPPHTALQAPPPSLDMVLHRLSTFVMPPEPEAVAVPGVTDGAGAGGADGKRKARDVFRLRKQQAR